VSNSICALFPATKRVRNSERTVCVVKARVGEVQTEGVLEVDPTAHRIGGLPIGKAFSKLHQRDQR
jgi:hypothetical protein